MKEFTAANKQCYANNHNIIQLKYQAENIIESHRSMGSSVRNQSQTNKNYKN